MMNANLSVIEGQITRLHALLQATRLAVVELDLSDVDALLQMAVEMSLSTCHDVHDLVGGDDE
ncbi:TPA: hypothetical protein ACNVAS_004204 [Citrobacter amalonaticus]|uniref:hypothetical protein n=1 Tax=Citrobacter TaxID=544 RepID=UPI00292C6D19|nr:hypothetical protein [Citrobacter amalonaticus]EKW3844792.1 hypothetical protein [Citrobacter amalonaticus]MDV0784221.1 hypothetical protein [Citrobacter amalonaticus]MEB0640284.1 hypothetical protein [Citrobacter amalonaticus]